MVFRQFRLRGRTYYHLGNGWCARQVENKNHQGQSWRLYWGILRPGSHRPMVVQPYVDEDEEYVDLKSLEECSQWVDRRKKDDVQANA